MELCKPRSRDFAYQPMTVEVVADMSDVVTPRPGGRAGGAPTERAYVAGRPSQLDEEVVATPGTAPGPGCDPLLGGAGGQDSPCDDDGKGQGNIGRSETMQRMLDSLPEEPQSSRLAQYCKRFVILPGSATGSWWLEAWDVIIMLLVFWVAYYEPFAIALFTPDTHPWYFAVVDHALTLAFTVDMVLQFFTAIPHAQDSLHKDLWEQNVFELARRYVALPCTQGGSAGWFWVDLLAVIPGWYWVLIAGVWHRESFADPVLILRIARLFQTTRLERLARVAYTMNSDYGFPMFVIEVAKFVAITTIACHWMACVWIMSEGRIMHGSVTYQTDEATWLTALLDSKGDICDPNAHEDPLCVYIIAYYWATMTLTSVGYGDVTPQNKMEYCISTVCMFIVGYTWAFIVGTIVSILSNIDPSTQEFKHSLDELTSMMRRRGLSDSLQVRLKRYMHETRHFNEVNGQRKLIQQYFSDGLQREVAKNSVETREMLSTVYWMRDLQEDAILDIVRGLIPKAYGPQERINLRGAMVIVQRGILGVKGRVLSRGDAWGQQDILLETPQLIDGSMPITLSFVELSMLHRETLIEVARNYPNADRRLRRAQIRTAAARAFIYQAHRLKRSRASKATFSRSSSPFARLSSPCSPSGRGSKHGAESSFANPGVKRIHLMHEGTQPDPLDSVRAMIADLTQHVQELTEEVRSRGAGTSSLTKTDVAKAKFSNITSRFTSEGSRH